MLFEDEDLFGRPFLLRMFGEELFDDVIEDGVFADLGDLLATGGTIVGFLHPGAEASATELPNRHLDTL